MSRCFVANCTASPNDMSMALGQTRLVREGSYSFLSATASQARA
jgi:hypothetical protein